MAAHGETDGEMDRGATWFEWDGAELTLGVTLTTVDGLGDLERVTLPEAGETVSRDDILFVCEGTASTYEGASPVSGVVTAVNSEVLDEPGKLNEDPLDEGWLVKLEVHDESQIQELLRSKNRKGSEEG